MNNIINIYPFTSYREKIYISSDENLSKPNDIENQNYKDSDKEIDTQHLLVNKKEKVKTLKTYAIGFIIAVLVIFLVIFGIVYL